MVPNNATQELILRKLAQQAVSESLERICQHPFIVAANAQKLTQEQSERWIKCAGRESHSFPKILQNMVARCSNEKVRAILEENLNDEFGNGNLEEAHFKHYLHLLDNLGIPRELFYGYEERAGIKLALSLAYNISMQENEALAIGYMLVNEGMTPITYGAAYHALGTYHPAMETRFFQLHVEIDAKHVEDLFNAVDELNQTQAENLLFGISIGERGMAVLLDEAYGVYDFYEVVSIVEPVA